MDNKGRKWDGKSRISTDLYRKRWDDIFKKRVMEGKDPFVKEQEELKIFEKKISKGKLKATEKFLTEVAEDHGASADDDFDQGK
jgi:hypothetical protein